MHRIHWSVVPAIFALAWLVLVAATLITLNGLPADLSGGRLAPMATVRPSGQHVPPAVSIARR